LQLWLIGKRGRDRHPACGLVPERNRLREIEDIGDVRKSAEVEDLRARERIAVAVYTPDNVAKFYGKVLAERFRTLGCSSSTRAPRSSSRPSSWSSVVEGDKFHGTARMRVTLVKQGVVVWNGVFEGTSERWGKTHSQGLLNEALSIAYDDTLHNALSSAELAAALEQ